MWDSKRPKMEERLLFTDDCTRWLGIDLFFIGLKTQEEFGLKTMV
jgi:hypothetical protein